MEGPGDATFSALYEQVFTTCKLPICHGQGLAGVRFDSRRAAYNSLLEQPAFAEGPCASLGKLRVAPGEPAESLLFLKLQADAPCGEQMPPGGQLPEEARIRVRAWIAAGAPDD